MGGSVLSLVKQKRSYGRRLIMKNILAVCLGLLFIGWFSAPAQAQPKRTCQTRDKVLSALGDKYNETPSSMGLASNGSIVEILVSTEGTWTIIATMPNGLSCLVAAGDYWEKIPGKVAGTEM